jgi:NADH-quinone oxidoreductase subunit M
MPKYATVFMLMMLGSVGLPGTSGFVGEFLVLLGAFKANTLVALFATTGVVLGAAYMLVLYRRVVFGPQDNDDAAAMPDLDKRELLIFLPFVLLVLWLGVAPGYVMERVAPSAQKLLTNYEMQLKKAETAVSEEEKPADEIELPMPETETDE